MQRGKINHMEVNNSYVIEHNQYHNSLNLLIFRSTTDLSSIKWSASIPRPLRSPLNSRKRGGENEYLPEFYLTNNFT